MLFLGCNGCLVTAQSQQISQHIAEHNMQLSLVFPPRRRQWNSNVGSKALMEEFSSSSLCSELVTHFGSTWNSPARSSDKKINNCVTVTFLLLWKKKSKLRDARWLKLPGCISLTNSQSQSFALLFAFLLFFFFFFFFFAFLLLRELIKKQTFLLCICVQNCSYHRYSALYSVFTIL